MCPFFFTKYINPFDKRIKKKIKILENEIAVNAD
jgi:hypothetical protein